MYRPRMYCLKGEVREAPRTLLALGVDGIFADHPDIAVEVMRSSRGAN